MKRRSPIPIAIGTEVRKNPEEGNNSAPDSYRDDIPNSEIYELQINVR